MILVKPRTNPERVVDKKYSSRTLFGLQLHVPFSRENVEASTRASARKRKSLIGFCLCLLHLFLCQGCFHDEIRTHALVLVSVLVLASLMKFFKSNYKKNRGSRKIRFGPTLWSKRLKFNFWSKNLHALDYKRLERRHSHAMLSWM